MTATTTATRKTTIVCNTFTVKRIESDNTTVNPTNTIDWTIITSASNNINVIINISNLHHTNISNKGYKVSNNSEKKNVNKKIGIIYRLGVISVVDVFTGYMLSAEDFTCRRRKNCQNSSVPCIIINSIYYNFIVKKWKKL